MNKKAKKKKIESRMLNFLFGGVIKSKTGKRFYQTGTQSLILENFVQ
jgi:hypothetical protein